MQSALHQLPAHPVELAADIVDDVAGLEAVGQHVPGIGLDFQMPRQRLLLVEAQRVLDGKPRGTELAEIVEEYRHVNVRAPFALARRILLEGRDSIVNIEIAVDLAVALFHRLREIDGLGVFLERIDRALRHFRNIESGGLLQLEDRHAAIDQFLQRLGDVLVFDRLMADVIDDAEMPARQRRVRLRDRQVRKLRESSPPPHPTNGGRLLKILDETVEYFNKAPLLGCGGGEARELAHLPIAEANAALRRHLGIVYDICHQAVEYEDITQSLQKLVDGGVPIFKLQEAAALYVPEVTQGAVDTLKKYAKTIYLTQTIEKRNGKINHYLNVDDAIAAFEKDPGGQREWRTHIDVPVFLDDLGQFRTTRFAIEDALRFHKQKPLSRHLEVETYTWDMLPDSLKTGDIVDYVCRELDWCAGSWCRALSILGAAP